jgi:hypothetical protein
MSSTLASRGTSDGDAERLLQFNRQLIDQALALVSAFDVRPDPAYGQYTGPHLRHVIEHYEALLLRESDSAVNYDKRARDRELESSVRLARARLIELRQRLTGWPDAALEQSIIVLGQAGEAGEFEFTTRSSVGRELVFLASHTIHHFALLQVYCEQHGIPTACNFGRAPSTLANDLHANTDSPSDINTKEFA